MKKIRDSIYFNYMLLKAKSVWLEERSHWLEYITEKKCDKNLLYGIADLYHKIAEERLFVAACDNILYSLDCSQDNKYIEKAMSLKSRQVIEINNRVKLSGNMYEGEEPYIFISYSHNEPERVFPIVATMQKKGYRIWLDKGIIPAKSWGKDITQHIKNCAFFLAFISENYLSSENCLDELMYARKQDKPKLLVHLEKVKLPDEVDMRYGRIQGILLYTCMMQEEFYKKLDKADGILCCNILEHN